MSSETSSSENGENTPVRHPRPRQHRRRILRLGLLVLIPAAILTVALYVYYSGGRYVTTDNAYIKADKVTISPEVAGPITTVAVAENDPVAKGDVLFRIDDEPYRVALRQANARIEQVATEIESLKVAYQQKTEELSLARENVAFADREYNRQRKLAAGEVVSESKLDAARHERDVARRRVAVIEREQARIRSQLKGDPEISVAAHPRYVEAQMAYDAAALDVARTVVRAPFDGVASNTPQIGQYVKAGGPVMSLVAKDGVWVDANFKETKLTNVVPGQKVRLTVDAYPDRSWSGVVTSISQATGAEFSVLPPQNATGNWVKVVQRIPVRINVDTGDGDPELRAGMSAEVQIDTERRRPLPGFIRAALAILGAAPTAVAEAGAPR